MADHLSEPLAQGVEMLRRDVLTAGSANAKLLRDNAELWLASIASFVVETPDLQQASFRTVQNVCLLARLLYMQGQIAETEDARRRALAEIDGLVVILARATPNQRARSMGFCEAS
jgi:hypothetical protein